MIDFNWQLYVTNASHNRQGFSDRELSLKNTGCIQRDGTGVMFTDSVGMGKKICTVNEYLPVRTFHVQGNQASYTKLSSTHTRSVKAFTNAITPSWGLRVT